MFCVTCIKSSHIDTKKQTIRSDIHHQFSQRHSVATGISEEHSHEGSSWNEANACICYYLNPLFGRPAAALIFYYM